MHHQEFGQEVVYSKVYNLGDMKGQRTASTGQ